MARLFGKATIKYDGKLLKTLGEATCNLGGPKRQGVVGHAGPLGYTEEETIPYVECTIGLDGGTRVSEIAKAAGVTVLFQCDTGQVYTLQEAWLVDPLEVKTGTNGNVKLRFEGMRCDEMGGGQ